MWFFTFFIEKVELFFCIQSIISALTHSTSIFLVFSHDLRSTWLFLLQKFHMKVKISPSPAPLWNSMKSRILSEIFQVKKYSDLTWCANTSKMLVDLFKSLEKLEKQKKFNFFDEKCKILATVSTRRVFRWNGVYLWNLR